MYKPVSNCCVPETLLHFNLKNYVFYSVVKKLKFWTPLGNASSHHTTLTITTVQPQRAGIWDSESGHLSQKHWKIVWRRRFYLKFLSEMLLHRFEYQLKLWLKHCAKHQAIFFAICRGERLNSPAHNLGNSWQKKKDLSHLVKTLWLSPKNCRHYSYP